MAERWFLQCFVEKSLISNYLYEHICTLHVYIDIVGKSYFSKLYQSSLNKRRTITSKSAQSLSTFANNNSNGIF
jgi:hypothetical protein